MADRNVRILVGIVDLLLQLRYITQLSSSFGGPTETYRVPTEIFLLVTSGAAA